MTEPLNRYELENAIEAIDGYWSHPPYYTEKNARAAFEAAKEQNRIHRMRAIECIESITFEQWLEAKPGVAGAIHEVERTRK